MKEYRYNSTFLAEWMAKNPQVLKQDILNVLNTKDFASLRRWAAGEPMPVKSIVKFCNHFQVGPENFFMGMLKPLDKSASNGDIDTYENVSHETNSSTPNNDITANDNAILETSNGNYQKAMLLAARKQQSREDEMRKEYDARIDDQHKRFIDTINAQNETIRKQADQIVYLTGLLSSMSIQDSYRGVANEPAPHQKPYEKVNEETFNNK